VGAIEKSLVGARNVTASDIVAAIEREESGIDIAMLDLAVPGMNGAEAAQRIRINAVRNVLCLVPETVALAYLG